jgi:hypothetical protein
MDELFRFVALRPPSSSLDAIVIVVDSPLAVRLASVTHHCPGLSFS